jgi:hypothetical protein
LNTEKNRNWKSEAGSRDEFMKKKAHLLKPKQVENPRQDPGEVAILPPSSELKLCQILFKKVSKFLMKRYPDFFSKAFDDFKNANGYDVSEIKISELDESERYQFYDWMIHTPDVLKKGFTGIELYIEYAERVNSADMIVLKKMNDSVVTLFQLNISKTRNKVFFDDLLLNYKFEKEIDANSDYYVNGSIVAARVYTFGGMPVLGLSFYPFFIKKKTILHVMHELFAIYSEKIPDSTWENFLREGIPLTHYWFEMMNLMNNENIEDDEEDEENYDEEYQDAIMSDILICNALFFVLDYRAVKKKIETTPYFSKYDEDIYEWYDEPGEKGEANILGMITISREKLALVTGSPELREKGKFLLLSVCRDIIRHNKDFEGIEDIEKFM